MLLRPYQQQVIQLALEHIEKETTHPILCLTGGAGKSVIIAKIAEILNKRTLIVADRKELLVQNNSKFHPDCDVGLVSAGLNKWELDKQIVIGGIQTVYNKAKELGDREIIIIDECDLWSGDESSMYGQLAKAYPKARIVGLTGTPFRTNEGKLTWGEIICNITYKDLLEKNYLSPITNKIGFKPDLSKLGIVAGDYSQKDIKEQYLDKNNIGDWVTKLAVCGEGRKKWLVFLPSVEHAQNFAFGLSACKILARAITAETKERDEYIEQFRNGELQCLVGVGVFERGFDVPDVDLIADFSPTKSLKKWLQRIWRGVRKAEGKKDCLYLDFAGNLKEHQSIHNQEWLLEEGEIKIKKKYVEKVCPSCEAYTPVFKKHCVHCGYEFIVEKQEKKAYNNPDFKRDINTEEIEKKHQQWYNVTDVEYDADFVSGKGNKMLRVTYHIGVYFKASEVVFNNQRTGWLIKRGWKGGAIDWQGLKTPKKLFLDTSSKYPKILEYGW